MCMVHYGVFSVLAKWLTFVFIFGEQLTICRKFIEKKQHNVSNSNYYIVLFIVIVMKRLGVASCIATM